MRRTLVIACTALLAAAAAVAAVAGEQSLTLHEGAGRDLTAGRCAICHSLDYIPNNAPVMDRTGWQKIIQKMRERFGAPISDPEAQQILDYLAGNYAGKS
ncbi:MAG: cytochrome c [Gammaproteobacteria bacterium]|nr:cytochrome c [Gammaproteobacteria bacterium]